MSAEKRRMNFSALKPGDQLLVECAHQAIYIFCGGSQGRQPGLTLWEEHESHNEAYEKILGGVDGKDIVFKMEETAGKNGVKIELLEKAENPSFFIFQVV